MARPQFTNSAYVRSHQRQPRGRGTWAFGAARTPDAFDVNAASLVIAPSGCTLREAKQWMAEHGHSGLWAVMP